MTTAMLLGIIGLAVVESLNPSALVVTIALLSSPRPAPRVFAYVAGIFTVFFTLGLVAVIGGKGVLDFLRQLRDHRLAYQIQIPAGIALLSGAVWALTRPPAAEASRILARPPDGPVSRMFLLGIGVTVVEALTAFPYFAALALLLDAEVPRHDAIVALIAFNLCFITPPLLLLWTTTTLGRRAPEFLARVRAFLDVQGRLIMLWIFAGIGVFLTVDAIIYLA